MITLQWHSALDTIIGVSITRYSTTVALDRKRVLSLLVSRVLGIELGLVDILASLGEVS